MSVELKMKLYEVQDRSQPLLDTLLEIWEQSVRATHLFLSDAEVNAIRGVCAAGAEKRGASAVAGKAEFQEYSG